MCGCLNHVSVYAVPVIGIAYAKMRWILSSQIKRYGRVSKRNGRSLCLIAGASMGSTRRWNRSRKPGLIRFDNNKYLANAGAICRPVEIHAIAGESMQPGNIWPQRKPPAPGPWPKSSIAHQMFADCEAHLRAMLSSTFLSAGVSRRSSA